MTDEYLTLAADCVAEGSYSEKRSRFLAFAHHVTSAAEVKTIVAGYRRRFFDARHVCYAYRLGPDGADHRANDDGEPSGTAGRPILGQLVARSLTDALVVVVRYYGGVNLGTGGLLVAYREATAQALDAAQTVTKQVELTVSYTFPYMMTDRVMRVVRELGPRVVSQTYDTDCTITLAIRQSEAERLRQRLEQLAFDSR